jgi:anaerobic selenocysteine-containing dehydrogenase
MRRMGFEPPAATPADDREAGADLAMLSTLMPYARCSFEELAQTGYVETAAPELPAAWIDEHVERLGGWRLAPAVLLEQLASVSRAQLEAADRPQTLTLIPRRQRRHVNAQFLFLGDSSDVLLNPDEGAALGVEDGQEVVVRSIAGEIRANVRLDAKVRRGVISVPHGHVDANVNLLTSIRQVDPVTGMARYSGVPVTVEPVAAALVEAA